MRVARLDHPVPLKLRFAGVIFGVKFMLKRRKLPRSWLPPDIFKLVAYRSGCFGGPFLRAAHETLRGDSEWSVGERELFAAFVSSLNQCPF